MSLESLRVWGESKIQTLMNTNYPSMPVHFDNTPFNQPDTAWCAFSLLDGHSMLINIGTKKIDRHLGIIQFDCLVPQNTGTVLAHTVVELVGQAFRDTVAGLSDGAKIVVKVPVYANLGTSGGFFRMNVRLPFCRDEPLTASN